MGSRTCGIPQVWKTLFASLQRFQMPQRAEDKGAAPAPYAQAGCARTQSLLSPLHIKLHITVEMGQDHKALMNLEFINNFLCSLERQH